MPAAASACTGISCNMPQHRDMLAATFLRDFCQRLKMRNFRTPRPLRRLCQQRHGRYLLAAGHARRHRHVCGPAATPPMRRWRPPPSCASPNRHMTGIGGDCFALVGEPSGKVMGLNGSGRSSHRADAAWLKASGLTAIAPRSIHAITVPGAIDAWDQLLKRYGTMTLGDCLAPAIALAEQGVPVTPRVAFDWPEDAEFLAADPGGRQHYLVDGRSAEAWSYHALSGAGRNPEAHRQRRPRCLLPRQPLPRTSSPPSPPWVRF